MKKFLIICLCCVLLVGCGKKNNVTPKETKDDTATKEEVKEVNAILTCSKDSEDPIHFTTNMIYTFENNKLTNLGVKYVYDLSKYNDAQRKAYASSKLCETDGIKNTLGMTNCKEELVGTNYIVEGNAEKLFSQSVGTLEAIKASYVSGGWKCSVDEQ